MRSPICSELVWLDYLPSNVPVGAVRVKDDWPDVEKFAYRAYVWVKRECPSELKSNELLRYWLENWNINPDS